MGDIEHIDLNQVRRELWGKSHYFDENTMRYFSSRLLRAVKLPSGDQLALESYRYLYDGSPRFYRVVHFRGGTATRGHALPCHEGDSKAQAQRQFQKLLMGGLAC